MKFRLGFGLFLLFVFSGCLTFQTPPQSSVAASKENIFASAYPDGLLHLTATVLTPSGQISAAFSMTPAGELIQSLQPDILPSSLKNGSGFLKPAWSETDRKILFAHFSSDDQLWVIYSMDSDGKNLKNIYTAGPHKEIVSPIWSASSGEIYFLLSSGSSLAEVKLCRISAKGKDFTEVATLSNPGRLMDFKLSPDEKNAACVYFESSSGDGKSGPTREYVIHLINSLNGSEQRRVPGFDLAWSPDSKTIAVIKEKSASIQITDIATGEIKLLNTGARLPKKIAWKPDGSSLAYLSESKSEKDEKFLLQILSLNNDAVRDVPVKIVQYWASGLYWTH